MVTCECRHLPKLGTGTDQSACQCLGTDCGPPFPRHGPGRHGSPCTLIGGPWYALLVTGAADHCAVAVATGRIVDPPGRSLAIRLAPDPVLLWHAEVRLTGYGSAGRSLRRGRSLRTLHGLAADGPDTTVRSLCSWFSSHRVTAQGATDGACAAAANGPNACAGLSLGSRLSPTGSKHQWHSP